MVMKRRSLYASTRFVDWFKAPVRSSRPHSAPLIVCSKDRAWVARKAWSSIDLVRPCQATLLCSFDCLFEGPALGCEKAWSSIDLVRPCRAGHTTVFEQAALF
jgi:hypothetical protein